MSSRFVVFCAFMVCLLSVYDSGRTRTIVLEFLTDLDEYATATVHWHVRRVIGLSARFAQNVVILLRGYLPATNTYVRYQMCGYIRPDRWLSREHAHYNCVPLMTPWFGQLQKIVPRPPPTCGLHSYPFDWRWIRVTPRYAPRIVVPWPSDSLWRFAAYSLAVSGLPVGTAFKVVEWSVTGTLWLTTLAGIIVCASRALRIPKVRLVYHKMAHAASTLTETGTRCEFVHKFETLKLSLSKNHSHPNAAADRNAALRAAQAWIRNSGYTPYSTSGSTREKNPGMHGWWMGKDTAIRPKKDDITDDHIILSVDDDYYLDLPELMASGRPMLLYTFAPRTVSGVVADAHYYINADDTVTMRVNGGAVYTHELWDWNLDTVAVDDWKRLTTHFYSVERRVADQSHDFVLLTPIRRVNVVFGYFLASQRLQRRRFARGKYTVAEFTKESGECWTSIGLAGTQGSANLPTRTWEAIKAKARADGIKSTWTVSSYLNALNLPLEEANFAAAILRDYLVTIEDVDPASLLTATLEPHPSNYTATIDDPRADLLAPYKEIGRVVARQVTNCPSSVPTVSHNNDLASIVGRLERVANDTVPPNVFLAYADDFACYVIGQHRGSIVPWTVEQVIEVQDQPLQRARNQEVEHWMYLDTNVAVSAMMKKETTTACGDPRNISTLPTRHNLNLSRYTYPVKKLVLSSFRWYCPGQRPRELAEQIAERCTGVSSITEADGSRFDGRVSKWLMDNVQRRIYLGLTHPTHRGELRELLDADATRTGKTASGIPYDCLNGRKSGSALTTDGNTLITAYIDYAAQREAGYAHEEAVERLLAYAGDDILSLAPAVVLESTSRKLGMVHECIARRPGEPASFLGRDFLGLCVGDARSIQSFYRTIDKIHISFAPKHIPLAQALADRAFGYLTVNPGNPVLAAWCRAAMRAAREASPDLQAKITKYDSPFYLWSTAQEEKWNGWPEYDDVDEAFDALSQAYGIDTAELRRVVAVLEAVDSMESFQTLPVLLEREPPKMKNDAVVHDDGFTPSPRAPMGGLPKRPARLAERQRRCAANLAAQGPKKLSTSKSSRQPAAGR